MLLMSNRRDVSMYGKTDKFFIDEDYNVTGEFSIDDLRVVGGSIAELTLHGDYYFKDHNISWTQGFFAIYGQDGQVLYDADLENLEDKKELMSAINKYLNINIIQMACEQAND